MYLAAQFSRGWPSGRSRHSSLPSFALGTHRGGSCRPETTPQPRPARPQEMDEFARSARYERVKARRLPVSELLQRAVEAELRRFDLLAETDRYVDALVADVGHPSAAQQWRADAMARRIAKRSVRKAG